MDLWGKEIKKTKEVVAHSEFADYLGAQERELDYFDEEDKYE